jgi:hypothetical protein
MPQTSAISARPSSPSGPRPEPRILFQKFFKSVGPRTYAAQLKEAGNGNHFIVLTEGKRDEKTGEIRKTRLFVFSEDFPEFFSMLKGLADFVKAHPVPAEVRRKRERFWARQSQAASSGQSSSNPGAAMATRRQARI